jgi:hypothetical protein
MRLTELSFEGRSMGLPIRHSFDEILLQLTRIGLPAQPVSPRKVLFWGERVGEISSYVAGWLAGKGMEVIVLDGANRFDPYMVSSFARKALISPERLLKRIRIARAFTCYQMAAMVGERLNDLFGQEGEIRPMENRWVILLGPVTPFLDEDVSEREVRPLFERSLKKVEGIALRGVPFLLFQSNGFSENLSFTKGGMGGLRNSKRVYLMRRLFELSDEVWKISLDDQEPKVVLEKGIETSTILRRKHQIPSTNTQIITNIQ